MTTNRATRCLSSAALRCVGHVFKHSFTGNLLVCNFEASGTTDETRVPGQM